MSEEIMWHRLESQVCRQVDDFPGVAGVCVRDLIEDHGFSVLGDEIFPTASTIKIHVLTQLLLRAQRGEIDLDERVTITSDLHVPGSGVLTYLGEPLELTLTDIATLMIIVSDNTATNMCIDVAGIEDTNQLINELGLTKTVLRRKMQDHEAVARGEENVSTPNECVRMLQILYEGQPTPEVAEHCIAILKKRKSATLFSSAIPRTVPLANKPGGMSRVRCDAGIVFLERRPYAMAIMTKYALCEHPDQEQFIVDTARLIHSTMSVLADTNEYGQGLES